MPIRGLLVAFALLLAACSSGGEAPRATPSPVASVSALAELRDLFAARRRALAAHDLHAYERTYDGSKLAFAACMREQFDAGESESLTPIRADPFGMYYRVIVADAEGDYQRLFARRDAGTLQLTEPAPDEIGELRSKIDGPIRVNYWAIDEDIADGIAIAAHQVYEFVAREALVTTKANFSVQLYPLRSLSKGAPCWIGGSLTGSRIQPVINLPVYALSFDAAFRMPSSSTYLLVRHEALHWIQEQNAPGAFARAPWWLVEGWPEFMSHVDPSDVMRALCITGFPALHDVSQHRPLTQVSSLEATIRYSVATTMVDHVVTTYGQRRYWELYAGSLFADNDRVFKVLVGHDQAAHYEAWLDWAMTKYC